MSRLVETRLRKLEGQRKARPELRSFCQEPGESPEQLRARARRWQTEKPNRMTPRLIEVEG